jgi:hypothetical protein
MLDGNAVAGLLQEVFVVETTTAITTCAGCGAPSPMGRPTSSGAPGSSSAARPARMPW